MLEKYGLDFFLYSPKDLPRIERHRRFVECKRRVVTLLSIRPMGLRELWYELDRYQDVREAVLKELRQERVVGIKWYSNPTDEKGEYYLTNRKAERT